MTTRDDAKIFARTLSEMRRHTKFSIADVQGYLMQYKQSPKKALENTNQLREMVQSRAVSSSSSSSQQNPSETTNTDNKARTRNVALLQAKFTIR